jgi:hypothetical protein
MRQSVKWPRHLDLDGAMHPLSRAAMSNPFIKYTQDKLLVEQPVVVAAQPSSKSHKKILI